MPPRERMPTTGVLVFVLLPCVPYVDEFVFRLNDGNVKRSTLDRIDSIVSGFSSNRLSYKMLVLM
jgi:hypothetical protein